MNTRLLAWATACCLALVLPAAASAQTQAIDDNPDDSPSSLNWNDHADFSRVAVTVDGGALKLRVTFASPRRPLAWTWLDTDRNGEADYVVTSHWIDNTSGGNATSTTYKLPDHGAGCEPGQSGEIVDQQNSIPPVSSDTIEVAVPLSAIGGATSFRWASYGEPFVSDTTYAFDYAPESANPLPEGANPPADPAERQCNDSNGQPGKVIKLLGGADFPPAADNPGGGGGGGGTGGGQPQAPVIDVVRAGIALPSVVGLKTGAARARILAALGWADLNIVERTGAKPRGVEYGEVVQQTPAAGSALSSGLGQLPAVQLAVYAGPKPVGANRCLDALTKDLRGEPLDIAIGVLKKAKCRPTYDFKLGSGSDAIVRKVTPRSGPNVELQVDLPKDPRKHDLFLAFRENPNDLTFGVDDWALTADDRQRNFFTVQVVDRAGRLVQRATTIVDASDVGAPKDPTGVTNAQGERTTSVLVPKKGIVDVIVYAVGANDIPVYGAAQIRVVERRADSYVTTTGRVLKRGKTGRWAVAGSRSKPQVRAAAFDFGQFVGWLGSLFGGAAPQQHQQVIADGSRSAQDRTRQVGSERNGVFVAQLAIGGRPLGKVSGLPAIAESDVTIGASQNGVRAGRGPVIRFDGQNKAVGAASGKLGVGGGRLISDNGLGLLSDNGLGLIGAAGGNVIQTAGGRILAEGAGLLSDNGLGLMVPGQAGILSDGGSALIGAAGGNLVSDNGLGLISVGNAGIIGSAAGN